jgi:Rps23 Pro-64 3,4-dihydroxylase Tpa1-like proline 4-hydroxylase
MIGVGSVDSGEASPNTPVAAPVSPVSGRPIPGNDGGAPAAATAACRQWLGGAKGRGMNQSVRRDLRVPDAERDESTFFSVHGVRLDADRLVNPLATTDENVAALRQQFEDAKPYKHLVIDGLFSPQLLECIHNEFDDVRGADWQRYDTRNEVKMGTKPNSRLGPAAQLYFDTIYSKRFIDFLSRVTGVESLITDPLLYNGGMHKIPTGGRFAVHLDFNKHPVNKLDNRLVFITYLNKDWKPEYGGALQLWNATKDRCEAEVLPVFGRSILMYHSSVSYHGHPDPIRAPDGRTRRSVAAYYYSNGRDDEATDKDHTTIFVKPITMGRFGRIALGVKYCTPPVLVDAFRFVMRRRWS